MSFNPKIPLAIDIGGTKTVVAVYRDGDINQITRFPTPAKPEEALRLIVEAVKRENLSRDICGVAIGAPGPLDSLSGRILDPPNLRGWWNFPLSEELSAMLGVPICLENDANLGALGEAIFGSGRGMQSMFYLTISTGIGSGLIIDNKIHGGRKGLAGEVWAFKPGFYFGNPQGSTVMELASGPGMVDQVRRRLKSGESSVLNLKTLDTPALLSASMAGDTMAETVLEQARDAIAGLLITVIQVVAPDAIVMGGGLCTENAWFIHPVRNRIQEWISIPGLKDIPVYRARLWDKAVLYGAAKLITELHGV